MGDVSSIYVAWYLHASPSYNLSVHSTQCLCEFLNGPICNRLQIQPYIEGEGGGGLRNIDSHVDYILTSPTHTPPQITPL